MKSVSRGRIRVGIGGWTYEPWRRTFYPPDVPKAKELEYASRQVTARIRFSYASVVQQIDLTLTPTFA